MATLAAIGLLASLSMFTGLSVLDEKPAEAAPGQLPASFTMTAVAGRGYKIGTGSANSAGGAQQQVLHPGAPNQCADLLNNEANRTGPGSPPDTNVDYNGTPVDAQCVDAADHDESVNTTSAQNPAFPSTKKQDRVLWQIQGTRSGSTLSIPVPAQAGAGVSNTANAPGPNFRIPVEWAHAQPAPVAGTTVITETKAYLLPVKGACTGISAGTDWTGTSAVDGTVTLTGCALYEVNIEVVSCSGICGVFGSPSTGDNIACRSAAFPMTLTTGTSTGVTTLPLSLTGTPYDTGTRTVKLVSANFVTGTTATTVFGSSTVCSNWGGTSTGIGLSANAVNRFEMQLAVDDTSSVPACLSGGIPQPANCWAPRAEGLGDQTVSEGAVTTIPAYTSFDPAGRAITSGFSQTVGPTPGVIKETGGPPPTRTFAAPSGANPSSLMTFGATGTAAFGASPYRCTTFGPFGPTGCLTFSQSQTGTTNANVTVNNVAPVANAGPDQRVTGTSMTLKGTSADPADPDCSSPGPKRVYTWTRISGPNSPTITPGVGAACRNATASGLVAGTYVFQVSVNDGDGGTGTDTVSVTVVPPAGATELKGRVTNSATGAAVSGATVSIYTNPLGSTVGTTTTNGVGEWSWTSAAPLTNYYVKFTNAGMVDTWYRGALSSSTAIGVVAPNALVDGQVGVARTISGTITAAVGGAGVAENVRLLDENGWVATTTSSPGGTFAFTNVPAKNTYRVQVAKASGAYDTAWYGTAAIGGPTLDGGQASKIDVTAANFTLANVSLYTPAQSGLTGTVDGCVSPTTCAGVQVRFYQPTASGGAWVGSATTNGSGVFDMSNLRPGTYRIWFWTKSGSGVPANTSNEVSEWYNNLPGEQYQNTGSIADSFSVGVGPGTTIGTYTL